MLRNNKLSLPEKITFEVTLACNLNCSMCDRMQKSMQEDMSCEDIERMIKNLPKSIKSVYITGGEPTLRSDINDICRLFLERGIKVLIQTNGAFGEKVGELIALDGIEILLSLDGPMEMHDNIRGCDGLFMKNIDIIKQLKTMNRDFSITTVITDSNLSRIRDLVLYLNERRLTPKLWIFELQRLFTDELLSDVVSELQIDRQDIELMTAPSFKKKISFDDFKRELFGLKKFLKKSGIDYMFYPANLIDNIDDYYHRRYRDHNRMVCANFNEVRIDPSGNIVHCFVFRKKFGNILEKNLVEIWNSDEMKRFREELLEKNMTKACEGCFKSAKEPFDMKKMVLSWFKG